MYIRMHLFTVAKCWLHVNLTVVQVHEPIQSIVCCLYKCCALFVQVLLMSCKICSCSCNHVVPLAIEKPKSFAISGQVGYTTTELCASPCVVRTCTWKGTWENVKWMYWLVAKLFSSRLVCDVCVCIYTECCSEVGHNALPAVFPYTCKWQCINVLRGSSWG